MRIVLAILLLVLAALPVDAWASEPVSAPEAVVLLHGLGRGPWGMKLLEWRLEHAGYRVRSIGYDTRSATIESAAASVHDQVQACCAAATRVHFVTHSLGGLVLRALLARHPLPNAGRAVLLAPPNRGSELVDRLGDGPLIRLTLGPLAPQLGTDAHGLPSTLPPPAIPFGVIAGDRWLNPVGAWLLPGPHDGTVSVASTRLDGMSDHLVVPHTHTFIMNSRRVARAVRRFLETERFREADRDDGS